MRENCADLGINVPLGMGKWNLGMGMRPVPKWVPMSRSTRHMHPAIATRNSRPGKSLVLPAEGPVTIPS